MISFASKHASSSRDVFIGKLLKERFLIIVSMFHLAASYSKLPSNRTCAMSHIRVDVSVNLIIWQSGLFWRNVSNDHSSEVFSLGMTWSKDASCSPNVVFGKSLKERCLIIISKFHLAASLLTEHVQCNQT